MMILLSMHSVKTYLPIMEQYKLVGNVQIQYVGLRKDTGKQDSGKRLQWHPLKSEFLENRGRYHKMVWVTIKG